MTDLLRAEFTVEPFRVGNRGAHGVAALEAVQASALTAEDGPFGTTIEGPPGDLARVLANVIERSMGAGATRVSIQVTRPTSTEPG